MERLVGEVIPVGLPVEELAIGLYLATDDALCLAATTAALCLVAAGGTLVAVGYLAEMET
jgi:hypothetical protein